MKTTITGLLAAAVVLSLLFALGGSRTGNEAAGKSADAPAYRQGRESPASASEHSFDFGRISMKAGRVSHQFALAASSTPRTITRISTSCMCTEAFLIGPGASRQGPFGMEGHGARAAALRPETVAAGSRRALEVVFDPAAHGPAGIGRIERAVTVEEAAGSSEVFTVKAFVAP